MEQINERTNYDNDNGGENSDKIYFVAYFICYCPEKIEQLSRRLHKIA